MSHPALPHWCTDCDYLRVQPEDFIPDEPDPPAPIRRERSRPPNLDHVVPFDTSDLSEEDRVGRSDANSQVDVFGGGWTDDEGDEGDDGPGVSPDVELSTRSPLQVRFFCTQAHLVLRSAQYAQKTGTRRSHTAASRLQ